MRDATLAISFQTVAELWLWADENQWGSRPRADLETFVAQFVFETKAAGADVAEIGRYMGGHGH